jgi:phosphomannomutase
MGMSIDADVFRAYDIRGVVPDELHAVIAERVGRVLARPGETMVVGRDMRTSSPELSGAVIRGLRDGGANVVDVGLVATPTFSFALRHLQADGGVQVTASHNPAEYNGLKIARRRSDGNYEVIGLSAGLDKIRDAVVTWDNPAPVVERGGLREEEGLVDAEVDEVLALGGEALGDFGSFRVVVDTGNGMGALPLAVFAERLSLNMDAMFFDLDGSFPNHPPDPYDPEALVALQQRVRESSAAIGVAADGDFDRIFFVDERGEIIPSSLVTALVAAELLADHPGERVLFDIRYVRNAEAAVRASGGVPQRTRVGRSFISADLLAQKGIFAGESSGHFFFRDTGYLEEPLLVLLIVLRSLRASGKTASSLFGQYRTSVESGEQNFRLRDRGDAAACIASLKDRYTHGAQDERDGLSVTMADWRFNVRPSNTEPLIRLNIEANDAARVLEKQRELNSLLTEWCAGRSDSAD